MNNGWRFLKTLKVSKANIKLAIWGMLKVLTLTTLKKEKLLSTKGLRKGYPIVSLGAKGNFSVHRLVAEAFVKRPKGKDQVNHINGVKTDNRSSNLEWVTGSENMQHALKSNLWKPNTEKAREISHEKSSIAVNQINEKGDVVNTFKSISSAERETGIKHISCVTLGKRKRAGGFYWKRVETAESC